MQSCTYLLFNHEAMVRAYKGDSVCVCGGVHISLKAQESKPICEVQGRLRSLDLGAQLNAS